MVKEMMRGVKPLPEAARSSMRSGVILYDLTSVVEELVFNSLDAGATKVSVFVGVGTCYVKVVDDGFGITRDGLVLVGERYATSKFDHSPGTDSASGSFGFRGEALASISDVSLLEILTKASGRPNGYRKVMKGCKCLYLGIDDDRKDVGTTVVVRDLFYNQPVRRKYMQSSEDELLRTISSPSPVALLKRTVGIEVSPALHELNISDGEIELSGYISSPCNSLAFKAFQYVCIHKEDLHFILLCLTLTLTDINSRFICKGPIHKLLNQLASNSECWDPGKDVDVSQNRKRSRPQSLPAYFLNLSCPRSFYDLTFEPSKTYVEFKDWVPVLTFIDKAIQNFWKEKITDGESGCHGADMVGEDQMWKKDLLDGDLSELSKFGKKRSRLQNFQASPDLMEMLIKEDNHTSQKRHVRTSYGYLHENTEDFDDFQKQHIEIESGHHTDYSFQSRDDHLAKVMLTATPKKEKHPSMPDINFFPEEDYIMEYRSAAAEGSSNVDDNIFSSSWQDEPFKVDPSVGNGSTGSGVSCGLNEFGTDVEFTQDLVQPFLRSCSSKGRFPSERDLCTDGGLKFHYDGFRNKRRRGGFYNSVESPEIYGSKSCDFVSRTLWPEEESSVQPFPSVITKFDLYTEFDSPSRDFIKSIPRYGEHFGGENSFMNAENIVSCHKTLINDLCSVTSNSLSKALIWILNLSLI
ncbi:MUTL protein homolog 3 [Prunus dulcis]|uniref:MUTL protein homolog 3 n=1 Tax=Prunus dulcis TaxID=3755 RepID=A0A4Y1RUT3_PRUDU|nr:MUTL protein homolog 3 [Prunus dulcis]